MAVNVGFRILRLAALVTRSNIPTQRRGRQQGNVCFLLPAQMTTQSPCSSFGWSGQAHVDNLLWYKLVALIARWDRTDAFETFRNSFASAQVAWTGADLTLQTSVPLASGAVTSCAAPNLGMGVWRQVHKQESA